MRLVWSQAFNNAILSILKFIMTVCYTSYMSKTIEKQTYSSLFQQVASGMKTYEFRLADWDCQTGDTLVLVEIDDETRIPTGRTLRRKVGFVGKLDGSHNLDAGPNRNGGYWTSEDIEKYGYYIISLLEDKND